MIPFQINIGSATREEQAALHGAERKSDIGSKTIHAYTDASGSNNAKGIRVGISIKDLQGRQNVLQGKVNIGPNQEVYNGELEAIVGAIETIVSRTNLENYKIKIFTDSQAALH